MRIVNLKEFMMLENILYTEYDQAKFQESNFLIKYCNSGDGKVIDWIESPVQPSSVEHNDYMDLVNKLEILEKDSTVSFSMDFEYSGRYGYYPEPDDDMKFAVYEKEDIKNLISVLQRLLGEES